MTAWMKNLVTPAKSARRLKADDQFYTFLKEVQELLSVLLLGAAHIGAGRVMVRSDLSIA